MSEGMIPAVSARSKRLLGIDSIAMTDAEIQRLVDERNAARAARDYKKADAIREQLLKEKVKLYDSKHSTRWRKTI